MQGCSHPFFSKAKKISKNDKSANVEFPMIVDGFDLKFYATNPFAPYWDPEISS